MDNSEFIDEVMQGNPEAVRAAVTNDPSLAQARNEADVSVIALAVYAGRSALAKEIAAALPSLDIFEASCIGDCDAVEVLLKASPELVNAIAPDGFSPLGFAAFFGHLELIELLLRYGADVEVPARNPMRVRPLHSAAAHVDQKRATDLARPLLREGADPNARQQGGFAPLHEAALNGNIELVQLLLEYGADPWLPNDEGTSPISLAKSKEKLEVSRVLELHAAQQSAEPDVE